MDQDAGCTLFLSLAGLSSPQNIDEVKEEMRAGEDRTNKRIDEVKVEMKEFKQEMGEIKTLLIQALRLPPPAQP